MWRKLRNRSTEKRKKKSINVWSLEKISRVLKWTFSKVTHPGANPLTILFSIWGDWRLSVKIRVHFEQHAICDKSQGGPNKEQGGPNCNVERFVWDDFSQKVCPYWKDATRTSAVKEVTHHEERGVVELIGFRVFDFAFQIKSADVRLTGNTFSFNWAGNEVRQREENRSAADDEQSKGNVPQLLTTSSGKMWQWDDSKKRADIVESTDYSRRGRGEVESPLQSGIRSVDKTYPDNTTELELLLDFNWKNVWKLLFWQTRLPDPTIPWKIVARHTSP